MEGCDYPKAKDFRNFVMSEQCQFIDKDRNTTETLGTCLLPNIWNISDMVNIFPTNMVNIFATNMVNILKKNSSQ